MYAVRLWSVRHAGFMNGVYRLFERVLIGCDPVLRRIGYDRLERPTAAVERRVKGLLFDCRMCGQCILSSTGVSCPMNCPKNLRNGPCGGVRPDGNCEVVPQMRCVWVEAWEGSRRMRTRDAIMDVQQPVDHRLWGRSAWLRVLRNRAAGRVSGTDASAKPPSATPRPTEHKKAA